MPNFSWKEYLILARFLEDQRMPACSPEAVNRTVVNRSYYAAFCSCRDFAGRHLGLPRDETQNVHRKVRDAFQNQGNPKLRPIAMYLGQLSRWRKQCDYENYVEKLERITSESLRCSEEILSRIE